MIKNKKIKILKIIKIILLLFFIPTFLLYILALIPDYVACKNCDYYAKNFWGEDVECFQESKQRINNAFKYFTIFLSFILILVAFISFYTNNLKKTLR